MGELCKSESRASAHICEVWSCKLFIKKLPASTFLTWTKLVFFFCLFFSPASRSWLLTGKPFIHPDGSAVVYDPAAGRIPQEGKTQPMPSESQQQAANHLHSQVSIWNKSADSGFLTCETERMDSTRSHALSVFWFLLLSRSVLLFSRPPSLFTTQRFPILFLLLLFLLSSCLSVLLTNNALWYWTSFPFFPAVCSFFFFNFLIRFMLHSVKKNRK